MKKYLMLIAVVCFAVIAMSFKGSYKSLWKKVEDYTNKNEAITALEVLESIQDKAAKDGSKAFGHYMKAYLMSLSISEKVGKTTSQEGIKQTEKLLDKTANLQQKATLNYFLLNKYISFFKENRYVFAGRTDLSDADSLATDLLLWSPNQFEQKIKEHFDAIFVDKAELLKSSSKDYQPLTEKSEFGYIFNNDLYHPLLFGTISTIRSASYNLDLKDLSSRLDGLLKEGLNDYAANTAAHLVLLMYHFDLDKASKSEKEIGDEYKSLIDKYKDIDVVVEVVDKYARLQMNGKDPNLVEVKSLCEEYIAKYPKYKRINILKRLVQNIESPSLNAVVKPRVYPGYNVIKEVNYKNISNVQLELYKVSSDVPNPVDSLINEKFVNKYATLIQTKSIDNLSTPDYKEKNLDNIEFATPEVGFYILKTSAGKLSTPSYSTILSSNIKVVFISRSEGLDVYTVNAESGLPIADVVIKEYKCCEDPQLLRTHTTDASGFVSLDNLQDDSSSFRTLSIRKGDDIAEYNYYAALNVWGGVLEKSQISGTILSDRAIYRPGQKLYLKGYIYKYNSSGEYNIAANYKDEVIITDGSGAELIKIPFTTNEYGTFSLEYDLPEQILLGSFGVNIKNIAYKRLRVEEYKRPTFSISFDDIEGLYSTGDKVKVIGRVDAFNGSLLKGAKVTVNVTQYQKILPFIIIPKGRDKLLSHDVLELNSDGTFEIEVASENTSGFINVSATLATLGGESQEASKMVYVDSNAIQVTSRLKADLEKEKDVVLLASVTNLDSKNISLKGSYELYINKGVNKKDSLVKVLEGTLQSNSPKTVNWNKLESGSYQLKYIFESGSHKGESIDEFVLFSTTDKVIPIKSDLWVYTSATDFNENNAVTYNVGTDLSDAVITTIYYTYGGLLKSSVQTFNQEMKSFTIDYNNAYQNGLSVVILLIKDNKVYTRSFSLAKRVDDKPILLNWSVFRDKIKPGAKEKWRLNIKDESLEMSAIEVLALMYDASLDQIATTNYNISKYSGRVVPAIDIDYQRWNKSLTVSFVIPKELSVSPFNFDNFGIVDNNYNSIGLYGRRSGKLAGVAIQNTPSVRVLDQSMVETESAYLSIGASLDEPEVVRIKGKAIASGDNKNVGQSIDVRTNFSETAFFLPHLYPNNKGEVMIEFDSPEQLTKWNIKALAHDKQMNTGTLSSSAYTVKEFTVSPNVPRFIRRGDNMELSTTVKNGTDNQQHVVVKFTWFNPVNNKVLRTETQNVVVNAKDESLVSTLAFTPKDIDNVGFKVEAYSAKYSDGEQHVLPILSDKEYLNEGLAIYKYEKGKSTLSLSSLFNGLSNTATDKSLTVEFTSDPIWYLMSPLMNIWNNKTEGTINTSNRLYANLIGYTFQKEYKEFLDRYSASTSKSNLFNNEELLNITLQESPWNFRALKQKEMLEQFNQLIGKNSSIIAIRSLIFDLKEKQKSDGGWEWYEGLGSSSYITYYITSVLAQVNKSEYASYFRDDINNMMHQGVQFLLKGYENKERKLTIPSNIGLTELQLMNLLGIESILSRLDKSATNFHSKLLDRVSELLSDNSIELRAMAANILIKAGKNKEAKPFVESLKQYLLEDASGLKYYGERVFQNLGVNAQLNAHIAAANAIYAFGKDEALLNSMKGWVVMKLQREVSYNPFQMFNVFQFLSSREGGATDGAVDITVNGKVYNLTSKTPYLKETIQLADNAKLGDIKIIKKSDAPLWGGVVGSYFENIENISDYKSEVAVEQKLYKEVVKDNNKELQPIAKDEIKLGDIIVSRVEFTLDENLDYLYLKVDRSSALEPFDILSGPNYSLIILYRANIYTWGNKYIPSYQSVRDGSTEYFYNSLEKGTYVLETRSYVSRKGSYQSGIARLQSLFSPEITAHSKSIIFKVR